MAEATAYVQVLTTTDEEQEAAALADLVLQERLAACVQTVGPISSRYWWQGELERSTEWLLIIKTRHSLLAPLVERLREAHSYDTPEITATALIGGNPEYLAWIADETTAGDQP